MLVLCLWRLGHLSTLSPQCNSLEACCLLCPSQGKSCPAEQHAVPEAAFRNDSFWLSVSSHHRCCRCPPCCAPSQVFPVVREHCGAEEQRQLVYRSLLVMPLRLLEQVLPWLMTLLTEEEAEEMRHNMRLAGRE